MNLLVEILLSDNISNAISETLKKSDAPGPDGVRPSQLSEYWELNRDRIIELIQNGKYEPGITELSEIVARTGKRRVISKMSAFDKMLARAIARVITPIIEMHLSQRCYSYRQGMGTNDLAEFAAAQIESGSTWVSEIDISNFFDNISHSILFAALEEIIDEKETLQLIKNFVECKMTDEEKEFKLAKGLLQGSPLSPTLSNLYLSSLDRNAENKWLGYCRYGDDIKIYTSTQKEGQEALEDVCDLIENVGLDVNKKKTGVFQALKRPCLGYEFTVKDGAVLIGRIVKEKQSIYHLWHPSVLKEINYNYHLVSDGILTKKDFTLLFENDNLRKYLPIDSIEYLNIYSNIIFSSGFFESINNEGICVNIINKNGEAVGRFIPHNQKRDFVVELAQIKLLNDEEQRLEFARAFQEANLFNIRAALRYYERRGHDVIISDAVNRISDIINKLSNAKSIEALMMYEAQARQTYFQCFNTIMAADDFEFVKRTRRPPEDALNAMISFGNTLLYTRFSNEIYRTHLDVRIGIVHSDLKRSENLNLDLADLFKPIIVDRTIFTLVNKKMINEIQDFEETEIGGIYMNYNGKKIFLREFEAKLAQKVCIDGQKITYSDLMKREVEKIERFFKRGEKYKPFKYIN